MATDEQNCNTCRSLNRTSNEEPCKSCKFSGFGMHEGQEPTNWKPKRKP